MESVKERVTHALFGEPVTRLDFECSMVIEKCGITYKYGDYSQFEPYTAEEIASLKRIDEVADTARELFRSAIRFADVEMVKVLLSERKE